MSKATVVRETPPPPKIEKIVVELTLEEARIVCVIMGMTCGEGGYPLYTALQKIPEVYSEYSKIKDVLRSRGYTGFRLTAGEFS